MKGDDSDFNFDGLINAFGGNHYMNANKLANKNVSPLEEGMVNSREVLMALEDYGYSEELSSESDMEGTGGQKRQ